MPRPDRATLFAALLLAVHAGLIVHCAATDSATFDEAGHIVAGVSYWQTGSYRLYHVNPPLTKLLQAIPVLLARPDGAEPADLQFDDSPLKRNELNVGERFAERNGERWHRLLFLARLPGVLWSVLGGAVIYAASRRLWGAAAGVVSVAAWSFEPNIIAHAHLATADVPGAVMTLAATLAYAGLLRSPAWWRAIAVGALLGVALLCKFTPITLLPIWLVAGACSRPARWSLWFGHGIVIGLMALLVVNWGYEFHKTGQRLGTFNFVSRALRRADEPMAGNRFRATWLENLPVPLPADCLTGIDTQRCDFDLAKHDRLNSLRGEWRLGGWWYYYLYAAAVKVPLGLWFLAALAIGARFAPSAPKLAPADRWPLLLVPLAVLVLVSSQQSIQSHLRYALPVWPFAIVGLGAVGPWASAARWRRLAVGALLAWSAVSYLVVHPQSLCYFNEAAGGPIGGPNHLLGSNVDWGQDLLRLKAWSDAHPEAQPLHVAYFGHLAPRLHGLPCPVPPLGPAAGLPDADEGLLKLGPQPGWFAVSVRYVHGQKGAMPDERGRYVRVPFCGLSYFREFTPVAYPGYAMAVYHITPAEADAARERLGLPPLAGSKPDDDPEP